MESASEDIPWSEIRERAYEIWERNHRPDGLEIRFWLAAERELRAERDRRRGREDSSGSIPSLRS